MAKRKKFESGSAPFSPFLPEELDESSLLQSLSRADVAEDTYKGLLAAGFDEATAAKLAQKLDPTKGRGVSPQELISLMDKPVRALPAKGGGGFVEAPEDRVARLKGKMEALKNLGIRGDSSGRLFVMPPGPAEQAGRDFQATIAGKVASLRPALPPGPSRSSIPLEDALSGMVASSRKQAAAGFLGGINVPNFNAPVSEALERAAQVVPPRGPSRGILEALLKSAGTTAEEASPLQRGIAGLASKLGAVKGAPAGRGFISKALRGLAVNAVRNPKMAVADAIGIGIPALIGAVGLGSGAIDGVSRMVTGDPLLSGPKTRDVLDLEQRIRTAQRARDIEEQARARRAVDNTVNLIRYAPEVANQVMAGRRLPKGAVMIGGQPRADLMQQLAEQMSNGAFQERDPLEGLGAIQ